MTTSALAIASQWSRTAVVVDADPFGGDIPAGLGQGSWPPERGLLDVVVDARTMSVEDAMRRRVFIPTQFGPPVLAGFGGLGQAAGVPWPALAAAFANLTDADVLADCGRHTPSDGVGALLAHSDHVVMVSGSSLREARASARLAPVLRALLEDSPDVDLSLLVVRPARPYSAQEIAQGCGLPLAGELPEDQRAAQVWSDGATPGRGFARSSLQRDALLVARNLSTLGREPQGEALVFASAAGDRT